MSLIEQFPYKREFIDPDKLWENAVTLDLVTPQIIPMPDRNTQGGWRSLPPYIPWEFKPNPSVKAEPTAFVVLENTYDRVNKLVDYFSDEPRMEACRKGKPSPKDFYYAHYDELVREAQELQKTDIHNLSFRYWLREAVYLNKAKVECTTFKVSVSKALFKYLGSKAVLDPSSGWGDRFLGAAAAQIPVYHGFDPNPRLRKAYDEMISFTMAKNPNITQGDYAITTVDFLKVELDNGFYDTVFTSPPYFDYEIYSMDSEQSVVQFPNLEVWINNFFLPYINKCWNALAKGGYFCFYINDTKTGKYVGKMYNHVNKVLKGTFLGVMAITDEQLSYGYPIWIWRK